MNPGDVLLISLPLFGGGTPKLRPALLLANLPGPYQNLLICGISTQLHLQEPNWNELVQPSDADFDFQRFAPPVFDPFELLVRR